LRDEGNESNNSGYSIPLSDLHETNDEDNDLFTYNVEHNIKNNVDWFPQFGGMISTNFGDDVVESDYPDSDSLISLDSDEEEGDQPRKKRYPEFNAVHDMNKNITFTVGHIFKDRHDFRRALKLYAIQNRFDFVYKHNDRVRVTAVCKENCGWRIHASLTSNKGSFQIKTFHSTHECGSNYYNNKVDMNFIANRYKANFRDDPTWTIIALKEQVHRDYNVEVPIMRCYYAKKMAINQVNGSYEEQYISIRENMERLS